MSNVIKKLKLELTRIDQAIHAAGARRYGLAIKTEDVRLTRARAQTSVWSGDVPTRTRKRVQRALRALPAAGGVRDADFRQRTFTAIRFLAQAWNGQCMSSAFEGHAASLAFECAAGHRFELKIHGLRIGNWCPRCVYDRRRYSIADAQRIAEAKGGLCLSTACEGSKEHLRWRCARHMSGGQRWMVCWGATGVVCAILSASNLRTRSWTASRWSAAESVFRPTSIRRRRFNGRALEGIPGISVLIARICASSMESGCDCQPSSGVFVNAQSPGERVSARRAKSSNVAASR
jgi:hypothetical protein